MKPKLTNVFERNLQAYRDGEHIIINQGGQGSSKTYSILQVLALIAMRERKRITVASYALPHLKQGAMSDFDRIVESYGYNPGAIKSISESTYYIGRSAVEFFGVEGNLAKVHGPRRDILFVNEANRKISYEVYDQLSTRTQGAVFLDFNPDQEFFIHDMIIPNFKHKLIVSTYLDNPYLPEKELQNILSKKDKLGFENWWKVYGLGQLGKLEGAILPNWRYGEFNNVFPFGYGCDFGFNAPDTLVKVAIDYKGKKIYVKEEVFKEGNSAEEFRQLILSREVNRNHLIVADCADARMISYLETYYNIKPVNKVKWTVPEALKMMQDYEIIVTDKSHNIAKELNNYIWSDKKAGIPNKGFDHSIDAIRYYFQQVINKETRGKQIWHKM